MQPASKTPASPIQVPDIDTDEPVAVIPVASVAPLDGPPDGERINNLRSRTEDHVLASRGLRRTRVNA